MLVTTEELARHLGDPNWIVIDTRHDLADPAKGPQAYAAGHIPGAYFMHVDEDLSGAKTGKNGRHPLPASHAFAAKLNERGCDAGIARRGVRRHRRRLSPCACGGCCAGWGTSRCRSSMAASRSG
jgi:hypothetical protein